MTDKERIAALEKELQIKSEGLRILTGQYGKVVSDLEKGGTLVPPKHAAVVFRPGGKYSLLMPKMGDKAKVPDHVLMAAATMAKPITKSSRWNHLPRPASFQFSPAQLPT